MQREIFVPFEDGESVERIAQRIGESPLVVLSWVLAHTSAWPDREDPEVVREEQEQVRRRAYATRKSQIYEGTDKDWFSLENPPTGEILRLGREYLGVSQNAVAKRALISRGLVAEVERGRRTNPHTLCAIARALVEIARIARGKEEDALRSAMFSTK